MKKALLIVLGIIIISVFSFAFKPVPKIAENKALIEKGIIKDIYERGTNDIVFVLENCETKFYAYSGVTDPLYPVSLTPC